MPNIRFSFLILLVAVATNFSTATAEESEHFVAPAGFENTGDYSGKWLNPKNYYYKLHPEVAAQILYLDEGKCKVRILDKLNARARPLYETEVAVLKDRIELKKEGWDLVFKDGNCSGIGKIRGRQTKLTMKKAPSKSKTLGMKPPKGAFVLFNGSNFDHWHHDETHIPVTWRILNNEAMEVYSRFMEEGKSKGGKRGGHIVTKEKFGDMQLHIEFRYPVEPGKTGQSRGNSGIKFSSAGEVQVLNSYALDGMWDECGALYKLVAAKVNAARPPLEWQTYDITLRTPRFDKAGKKTDDARITVVLNGHEIHSNTAVPAIEYEKVTISLQDHRNALQFRNIWLLEKK